MAKWLSKESDELGVGILTFSLGTAVRSVDARWLWDAFPKLPRSSNSYYLAAKLATFPSVSSEVKEWILSEVKTRPLGIAELKPISEVRDWRLHAWFESQLAVKDKQIQSLARRVTRRGEQLPKGIEYAQAGPDRSTELLSAEVDVSELGSVLKRVSATFAIAIPRAIQEGTFLSQVPIDRWAVTRLQGGGGYARLFFRLEDIDTVELVLAPDAISPLK